MAEITIVTDEQGYATFGQRGGGAKDGAGSAVGGYDREPRSFARWADILHRAFPSCTRYVLTEMYLCHGNVLRLSRN
jgi:hypothetical protein